ncbi:MAG: hypothetical protein WDN06_06370 [Asticcacaulis sp.]
MTAISCAATSISASAYGETLTGTPFLPYNAASIAGIGLSDLGFLLTAAILFSGWRRSEGESRTRYGFMLVAIVLTIMLEVIGTSINMTGNDWSLKNPQVAALIVCGISGPLVFAYAVLRHRVIDLGFAVNRTLVYGVVSFVVLLLFGLAEWGIEKVIPHAYAEANQFISAGIALCIFLVFHRMRDFIEHHVEKLFFRHWHEKEAALKTFVREAGFMLKSAPLIAAFIPALRAFSDGADTALYLADEAGGFRRTAGGLAGVPEMLDDDDPFMVTLRADRAAARPKGASVIALALPMIHRTEVTGVVLMGGKQSGFDYRPDEKELLAWAAHQIGLDLHALKIERLETRGGRTPRKGRPARRAVATGAEGGEAGIAGRRGARR